jgi:hypothetical protein
VETVVIPKINTDQYMKFAERTKDLKKFKELIDQLFEDQEDLTVHLALIGLINPEMMRGFVLCYSMIRAELQAAEIKELENLVK